MSTTIRSFPNDQIYYHKTKRRKLFQFTSRSNIKKLQLLIAPFAIFFILRKIYTTCFYHDPFISQDQKQHQQRQQRKDVEIIQHNKILSMCHNLKGDTTTTINNEEWDHPYIHIINTRFMQEQSYLKHLSEARLTLFKYFSLPTMIHQRSQNFIWIIKTDPNLATSNTDIYHEILDLLKPFANFFLVGSNVNYLIGHTPGAWRDGAEGREILSQPNNIFTGDVSLLCRAYLSEKDRIVLQTRLDADDGLHSMYIDTVQQLAMKRFHIPTLITTNPAIVKTKNNTPSWLYWCTRRHIEWYSDLDEKQGKVQYVIHEKLCVTPGITVGFAIGVSADSVPQYQHDKLYKSLVKEGGCGGDGGDFIDPKDCIVLIDGFMAAIRTRTPTSAGMMGVDKTINIDYDLSSKVWNYLTEYFDIAPDVAKETNQLISYNLYEIATDNMKGQCTNGHSCKLSSKESLQRLIETVHEGDKGYLISQH